MIKIKYLCEYPRVIPELAQIWHDSIGQKWRPDVSIAQIEAKLHDHLNKDALPLTYVAFAGEEPIGMCTLTSNDGLKSKLMPWLSSVCVRPDYRKRGIGKLLTQMAKEKAHKMGFEKLYLFIFDPEIANWYINDGWQKIEESAFQDKPVIIMEIKI